MGQQLVTPRTASVIVYQGDDLATIAELRRVADVARGKLHQKRIQTATKSGGNGRFGGDTSPAATNDDVETLEAAARDAEKAYGDFVEEAASRAVEVVIAALGKRTFQQLMREHLPRKEAGPDGEPVTHTDDVSSGVNTETFPLALLTYRRPGSATGRTIAAPEFATTDELTEFLEEQLSDGDYEKIWQTAWYLNRTPGADPKASRYSTTPQTWSAI